MIMKETPSEYHNRLAKAFVDTVAKSVVAHGASDSEFLVIVESVLYASLLILTKQYRIEPRIAAFLVEAATEAATERLMAEQQKRRV